MKNYLVMAGIALVMALIVGLFILKPVEKVVERTIVGSLSNPDQQIGAVRLVSGGTDSLTSATTTVCAIQSPSATSTLILGTATLTGSTTASTVTLAKATTPYATTTSLGSASLSANVGGTVVTERTAAGGTGLDEIFAPNTYFVVGMQGGIGTFSPSGSCKALWLVN